MLQLHILQICCRLNRLMVLIANPNIMPSRTCKVLKLTILILLLIGMHMLVDKLTISLYLIKTFIGIC